MTESDEEVRPDFDSDIDRLSYEIAQVNKRQTEHQERIEQLEYGFDLLVTNLPTQHSSKRLKKYDILHRAAEDAEQNASTGSISREKASGVADCSDRHARTLLRELGEAFDWAEYASHPEARLKIRFVGGSVESFRDTLDDLFPEVEP